MSQAVTRTGAGAGWPEATHPAITRQPSVHSADGDAVNGLTNRRPAGSPNPASFPFGAPPCRIFRRSRSAMQAGRADARAWVLSFEPQGSRWIEPLMGWSGADDPYAQIELTFSNLSAAIAYAEREGLDYRVIEPPPCRRVAKTNRDAIVGPKWFRRSDQMVPTQEHTT